MVGGGAGVVVGACVVVGAGAGGEVGRGVEAGAAWRGGPPTAFCASGVSNDPTGGGAAGVIDRPADPWPGCSGWGAGAVLATGRRGGWSP